jgi:hypothetical protein
MLILDVVDDKYCNIKLRQSQSKIDFFGMEIHLAVWRFATPYAAKSNYKSYFCDL